MAAKNANNMPSSATTTPVFSESNPVFSVNNPAPPNPFQVHRITEYPSPNPAFMNSQTFPSDMASMIDFILNKVVKLDTIETQQAAIISRLNSIESQIAENKRLIDTANVKIQDIEKSQTFVSGQYDTILKSTTVNKNDIHKLQGEIQVLNENNNKMHNKNVTLQEDVIDLKCRSMRDNLVFLGISVSTVPSQPPSPNHDDMETTSQGPGTYAQATASTGTPFNVFDQLPQEVQLRRKALIPEMVKLRAE
ncbi:hypothetical protein MAR_015503, partial [Mya arenaria]